MKKNIILRAKNIIEDYTPLSADCGLLCDKSCCKGDNTTGMLLFPGEETSLEVTEKGGVRLSVCNGSCSRNERPLSCMIFPFFPYINEDGKIEAVTDTRGINICPMIANEDKIRFSRIFLRRVRRVGRLLARDEKCREFLWDTSREIDKLNLFVK